MGTTLFVLMLLAWLCRFQMSGGVSQDMGTGVLALRSIHCVEMVCTTRYVHALKKNTELFLPILNVRCLRMQCLLFAILHIINCKIIHDLESLLSESFMLIYI